MYRCTVYSLLFEVPGLIHATDHASLGDAKNRLALLESKHGKGTKAIIWKEREIIDPDNKRAKLISSERVMG